MRWICALVVCGLILGAQAWVGPVMAQQPSDFYVSEFLWGELGAVAGGISLGGAGYYLGTQLLDCPGPLCFLGPTEWVLAGGVLGVAVGAGLGVTLSGHASGVEGNDMGAYAGALLGASVSVLELFSLQSVWTLLVTPAAFAVIGFNMGATLKDTGQSVTLPWRLDFPLLSLAF